MSSLIPRFVTNLDAAAQFGIQTIRFENPEQCERRLQALGS